MSRSHITAFMEKNAPVDLAAVPRRAATDERPLGERYPKGLKGTVLLRNTNLRMAHGDKNVPKPPPPAVYFGNPKSDITKGFEMIYQRSYSAGMCASRD
jgi:hypothetical protein